MAFTVKSPNFSNNAVVPTHFTCDGDDLSPALEWAGAPQATKSFVLIMDDPDAPMGVWDHWLLFNIPSNVTKLEEGIKQLPEGAKRGKNSWQRNDYGGPCPPDREHRYFFKLYALDTVLDLPRGASKHEIERAMKSHILAQAELIGRYNRLQNME
jgi:Raf kinase inhibitor-like YbhB/YbcL family protein